MAGPIASSLQPSCVKEKEKDKITAEKYNKKDDNYNEDKDFTFIAPPPRSQLHKEIALICNNLVQEIENQRELWRIELARIRANLTEAPLSRSRQ